MKAAAARAVRRAVRAAAPWAALAVSLGGVALPWAPAEAAEFRRLRAEQILTRVVGRDITDDFHWTEYPRRDGVLVSSDMGRRRNRRWKHERDMLCQAREPSASFDCFLRAYEADQPHVAFVRRHEGP